MNIINAMRTNLVAVHVVFPEAKNKCLTMDAKDIIRSYMSAALAEGFRDYQLEPLKKNVKPARIRMMAPDGTGLELTEDGMFHVEPKGASTKYENHLYRDTQAVGRVHRPKSYTYKATLDMGIAKGDKVIVDSPHNGLTIVEVVGVDESDLFEGDFEYKWVVQRIDTAGYQKRVETDEKAKQLLREADHVIAKRQAVDKARNKYINVSKAYEKFEEAERLLKGEE